MLKDAVNRHEVREPAQLDIITRFLFDKCGNITTAKRIADYLRSQRATVTVSRVQNYLSYLEEACLVHRCRRYDLKGLRHLELYDEFYMADVGIRHSGRTGRLRGEATASTGPMWTRTSARKDCCAVRRRRGRPRVVDSWIIHAYNGYMQKIQILFPDPQMKRLREVAREEDRPISEIIRRATEEYLDKLPRRGRGGRKVEIPTFDGGQTLVDPARFRELAHADRTGVGPDRRSS